MASLVVDRAGVGAGARASDRRACCSGRGRQRWPNRWKAALNAFEITFDGRPAGFTTYSDYRRVRTFLHTEIDAQYPGGLDAVIQHVLDQLEIHRRGDAQRDGRARDAGDRVQLGHQRRLVEVVGRVRRHEGPGGERLGVDALVLQHPHDVTRSSHLRYLPFVRLGLT